MHATHIHSTFGHITYFATSRRAEDQTSEREREREREGERERDMGQNQSYHHPKSMKSNFGAQTKMLRFDNTERESIECVFDNLAVRSHGKGMNMHIFMSFFMSDSLVGERLFTIFDRDHDGYLSYYEFAHGLEILFKGTLKERANMTFALYDMTGSGVIKKVDCKMMLHYMPTRILNFAEKIISHKSIAMKLLRKLESLDDGHLHGTRLTLEAEKYVSELKAKLDLQQKALSPRSGRTMSTRDEKNSPYRSDRSPSLDSVDPTSLPSLSSSSSSATSSSTMSTAKLTQPPRRKRGISGTMKRRRSKQHLSPVQLRRERSERTLILSLNILNINNNNDNNNNHIYTGTRNARESQIENICNAVFTSKHPYVYH